MSVYVMSDIHGNYAAFMTMLSQIEFSKKDTLYIIGDVIDRNRDSVKLLQYVRKMKNAIVLMGNHEAMMNAYYNKYGLMPLLTWYDNGGDVTKNGIEELPDEEKKNLLSWVKDLPLTAEIQINDKTYVLGHACPFAFTVDDILWERISPKDELPYNVDQSPTYICGHTPTINLENFTGEWHMVKSVDEKVYFIDCGAAYPEYKGSCLCCLRLDDEQVFYVKADINNEREEDKSWD